MTKQLLTDRGSGCLFFPTTIVVGGGMLLLRVWTCLWYWQAFVVPLGAPSLDIMRAFGIFILLCLPWLDNRKERRWIQRKEWDGLFKSAFGSAFTSLSMVGLGHLILWLT